MAEQLFYLLVYLFEAFIAYIYFSGSFEIKYKTHITVAVTVTLYLIGYIINVKTDNNIFLNAFIFFAVNFICGILLYDTKIYGALLHSSVLLGIMISTELITESGATLLFDIPIDAYRDSVYALMILGAISKISYLIVCKLISSVIKHKSVSVANNLKKNLPLFLYPIMSVIMLASFLYISYLYDFSEKLNLIFVIISVISLALSCFVFIFNQNVQQQESELRVLQAEKQKETLNQTFYEILEKKNEEQRIVAHDIKHHFAAINSMDSVGEIKAYLSTVQPQYNKYKFIGKTQNKMFDLVLSKYAHICENENIEFNVDVRVSNLSFIADNDLVSLISNALDNAVEAVKACSKPYINLRTKNDDDFIFLNVVNSCSSKPKEDGDRLLTTKPNAELHGYGMKSIQRTAKKYNGHCQWYYEGKIKEFHLSVIFNKNTN